MFDSVELFLLPFWSRSFWCSFFTHEQIKWIWIKVFFSFTQWIWVVANCKYSLNIVFTRTRLISSSCSYCCPFINKIDSCRRFFSSFFWQKIASNCCVKFRKNRSSKAKKWKEKRNSFAEFLSKWKKHTHTLLVGSFSFCLTLSLSLLSFSRFSAFFVVVKICRFFSLVHLHQACCQMDTTDEANILDIVH